MVAVGMPLVAGEVVDQLSKEIFPIALNGRDTAEDKGQLQGG